METLLMILGVIFLILIGTIILLQFEVLFFAVLIMLPGILIGWLFGSIGDGFGLGFAALGGIFLRACFDG